jgi:hypothetical protein
LRYSLSCFTGTKVQILTIRARANGSLYRCSVYLQNYKESFTAKLEKNWHKCTNTDAAQARAEAVVGDFAAQGISQVLPAFAKLGIKPGERLLASLENRAVEISGTLTERNISLALFLSRSFSRALSLALTLSLSLSRSLALALALSLMPHTYIHTCSATLTERTLSHTHPPLPTRARALSLPRANLLTYAHTL